MTPRIHKYANGGKVASKFDKSRTPAPRPGRVTQTGDTVRVQADSTANTLRSQRKRQMAALGLKDGGPVKMPDKGTRVMKPAQLPPPKSGPKPKKIGR